MTSVQTVPTQATLVDIARSLEPLIREAEQTIEETRRVPDAITDALYESGIYRAMLPSELGGLEADPVEWMQAVEEISHANGSVGWLCMLHSGQTFLAPDVMRELLSQDRWITAANIGRAAGKAVRVEGGYRISGRWPFTSGSPEANWLSGRSILHDENDEPVIHPHDGLPWFIVAFFPAADATLFDTWDGHGLRGTGSGDFEVKDLFVPTHMVNEMGIWERKYDRALFRYPFNLMAHGAHAIGLAQAAIDEFVGLAHQSARRGSYRQARLGKDQLHQYSLGKADATIRAARSFLHQTVRDAYENAHHNAHVDYELRIRLHECNVFAVHAAREAVDVVFRQAGSPAVFRGQRLERIHRDMATAAQHLLITESSYDRIGQYLITKDLPGGPDIDTQGTGFIVGPHPQHDRASGSGLS